MYVINNGKIRYIRYDYKTDKECSIFYIDTVRGKKVKNINSFKYRDDDKSIYYTHIKLSDDENSYVFNTRCINKKSKKVKDMRSFKLDAAKSVLSRENYLKIEKGKIYVLCEKKINVYSLNGNLLYTCKLPDGERTIRIDYDYSPEIVNYLTFNDFSVCGDYVYYCNRNGIYRWNMKGRGGFTLYYNAEGDEYFGSEYGAADICVKDENTIYLMLENIDDDDIAVPTKIVKYSRG